MFRKVLLPLDGSETAERALGLAVALVPPADGQLVLLRAVAPEKMLVADAHILGNYALIWPDQSLKLAHDTATTYLHDLQQKRLPAHLPSQTLVVEGEAAEQIVDTAQTADIDLIVMSSHGYSGFTRWLMGSVTERVLHQAPCPVLVVRATEKPRHMLIPLDGSPLAEKTLPLAFALAAQLGCQVTLLRSITALVDSRLNELIEPDSGIELESLDQALKNDAERYLQNIAAAYQGSVPQIHTHIVWHEQPAHSVLDYAQHHSVDLIAMSTHGRTGLQRWIYGSVTEKVLRAANTCSMLIVRSV